MFPTPRLPLFIFLIVNILVFFLVSYLIMLCYNNSIVKMNNNWKKIDYKTALLFTLLFVLILGFTSSPVGDCAI